MHAKESRYSSGGIMERIMNREDWMLNNYIASNIRREIELGIVDTR
jgi:hypothetical protein